MLRRFAACPGQRAIFKSEWPDGAAATLENVLRAVELGLDLDWGRRLFSPVARDEYQQRVGALWAEHCRQIGALRDEYYRQDAALRDECQRQEATLLAEYQRQKATIWAAAFLASVRL